MSPISVARCQALVALAIVGMSACGGAGHPPADLASTDLAVGPDLAAIECPATVDASAAAQTVMLPSACGVSDPAACNPLDDSGCPSGQSCEIARNGAFQCFTAGTATLGESCDGISGPECVAGLTCAVSGRCEKPCCADSDCTGTTCVPLRAMTGGMGNVGTCALDTDGGTDADGGTAHAISNHPGVFEGRGFLVPWTKWSDALAREMSFYAACAPAAGYPVFASVSHVDGNCMPSSDNAIPSMQDGVGILSYLSYDTWSGSTDARWLATATALGDYLVDQALTPNTGKYPSFPRSTGVALATPQPADAGRQGDMAYEIEPDKGGLAGYALVLLSRATGNTKYRDVALAAARTLVANRVPADGAHTPWPFRVDYRTAQADGDVSGDLVYPLRLFDELISDGYTELVQPRAELWSYIVDYQIPNAACGDGRLWSQFFEDQVITINRTAWAPLSLARYLLEKKEAVDTDWRAHVDTLLTFVDANFVVTYLDFRVCVEQDIDQLPYGGILSTYGAVKALYAKETGSTTAKQEAWLALNLCLYAINDDGCPGQQPLESGRGGWIEDAHLDVIHNFMDALGAFPEWAN